MKASIWLMSLASNNGAHNRHHNVMCVYSSSGVSPGWFFSAVAISSMSGSFQWPGEEYLRHLSWPKPLVLIETQFALISPVVRQLLAILPQVAPLVMFMLLERLKMTSRPLWRSAWYISSVSGNSIGFQSYFK